MKPYLDKSYLITEYVIKKRSASSIAKEHDCSETNIFRVMRRFNITRRTMVWTDSQLELLVDMANEYTLKEIAEKIDKTYDAVRLKAINLGIKSIYNPAVRDVRTRQKISASLQGITLEDWQGFTSTEYEKIRRSDEYKEWRRAVFKRDKNICQLCGDKSTENRNIELHADHIKPFAYFPELRFEVSNGRVLCVTCHKRTDTYGVKLWRSRQEAKL